MRNRKDGTYKVNPLGIPTTGCPLDEKISEMHLLKQQGDSHRRAGDGHDRQPDVPRHRPPHLQRLHEGAASSRSRSRSTSRRSRRSALTDVLELPYGFEIYGLLTRWNPLNVRTARIALPYNGKNVLVVGLGPAGYTLAHYLLNEGFGVVGIDGLKIEPLADELTGDRRARVRSRSGHRRDHERARRAHPGRLRRRLRVRHHRALGQELPQRDPPDAGAARQASACYGGVRFGGTLTIEDAWKLGFDHIAIAAGAGKPTIVADEEQPDPRHPQGVATS